MKNRDSVKQKRIDNLGIGYHLAFLCLPIALFATLFVLFDPIKGMPWLLLTMVSMVYLIGYSLNYYVYQGRLTRLWEHLDQVVHINETTLELVSLSNEYKDEHAFLDALLKKAVSVINGAEMGCIIRVDSKTNKLVFESSVNIDLAQLRSINLPLEQSFEYRLTEGLCDRVVVVNDIAQLNQGSSLSQAEQVALLQAPKLPVRSTLSSPIRINGQLYAMLNLDSSQVDAFCDYDSSLVAILTHEAASAISLFQSAREISRLANFDSLTGLFNRRHFEDSLQSWKHSRVHGSFLAIIDLDNLKTLNDKHGHQAGDAALAKLGHLLEKEWGGKALIARFGGDEFVVLSHGPKEQLEETLCKLLTQLELTPQPLRFSFGIAPYTNDWKASFREADKAMYEQKRRRKRRHTDAAI